MIQKYSADIKSEEEMKEPCDGLLGQRDAEEVMNSWKKWDMGELVV